MIGYFAWLWRRRGAYRRCFHHDHRGHESWISETNIDGGRKMFRCRQCEWVWIR